MNQVKSRLQALGLLIPRSIEWNNNPTIYITGPSLPYQFHDEVHELTREYRFGDHER